MKRFTLTCLIATVACLGFSSASHAEDTDQEKVAMYLTTYAELDGRKLDDNDKILIQEVAADDVTSTQIRITLRTSQKFWWKGVMLHNSENGAYERVAELTNAGPTESSVNTMDYADFEAKTLVLSKAKAFGILANVYQITDAKTHMKAGKAYIITWQQDW